MIKMAGCILIIFSCWGMGHIAALKLKMRVKELRCFKVSLQMLETEVSYSNTPLPSALYAVASKSDGPARSIFGQTSLLLKERQFSTVGDAFEKALNDNASKLSFSKEDMEILRSFGYMLGCSDTLNQVKNFNLVIKQLEAQETKAEESRGKNERMYNNLGFLSGLAITVLLL